jgi:hypothetical protein
MTAARATWPWAVPYDTKVIEARARELMRQGLDTRDAFGDLPRWASSIAEKEATERFLREQLTAACELLADATVKRDRFWVAAVIGWGLAIAGFSAALVGR